MPIKQLVPDYSEFCEVCTAETKLLHKWINYSNHFTHVHWQVELPLLYFLVKIPALAASVFKKFKGGIEEGLRPEFRCCFEIIFGWWSSIDMWSLLYKTNLSRLMHEWFSLRILKIVLMCYKCSSRVAETIKSSI